MKDRYRHVRSASYQAWFRSHTSWATIYLNGASQGRFKVWSPGVSKQAVPLVARRDWNRLRGKIADLLVIFDPQPCQFVVVHDPEPSKPAWSVAIDFEPSERVKEHVMRRGRL